MRTSDKNTQLVGALFNAKQNFPAIAKNKRGQSGNRQFNYAPLDEIMSHVDPVLYANGLMMTQGTEGHELVTRLEHVSGEWRETRMPVNSEHANMQSYGIEITYRRRYAYQLILGITTEEDVDIKDKIKRRGIDHTEPRNDNGTLQAGGTDNPKRDAFEALQPEMQDSLRKIAQHVTAAMPDAAQAKDILIMGLEEWPDEDQAQLKIAAWHLLDSKTRAAIKKVEAQ